MKAMLASALSLALGTAASLSFSAPSFAEEITWRPATSKTPPSASNAVHTSVRQATGAGITLGSPVSVDGPPVVRAKVDPDVPRALPLGKESKNGDKGPIVIISDGQPPQGSTKPIPPASGGEFVPNAPTPVPHGSTVISSEEGTPGLGGRLWGCGLFPGRRLCRDGGACCDGADGCSSCLGDDCCCPPRPRGWLSATYLYWGVRKQDIPPLLSAVNPAGAVPPTLTLFDGATPNDNFQQGGRFNLGFWLPRHRDWGLDVTVFFLANEGSSFTASGDGSAGSPTLARIITNAETGLPNALAVATEGLAGTFTVDTSRQLWGIDANVRRKLWCTERSWVDALFGYRHLYLEESINITDVETPIDAAGAPLVRFNVSDRFRTLNSFNGAQMGIQGECRFLRRWFVQSTLKVAVGTMHQSVDIAGSTTRSIPGGPTDVAVGGILALPSNIGHASRNTFAVVPEYGLKIGMDLNDRWRVWIGYDFLYASSVVRAGDQIDTTVNRTQIPFTGTPVTGPARPAVLFQTTDFWTQGISAGLEYRW